tara:strand:- start:87 stop:725 length:639 start_codon:yes stop_codon:yes gene_type:complete
MNETKLDKSSKSVVVFAHGWGGNTDVEGDLADKVSKELDSDVVRFDYEARDVDSGLEAVRETVERLNEEGYGDIYLVGHSFGGLLSILYDGGYVRGRVAIDPILKTDEEIEFLKGINVYEAMGISEEEFESTKGRDAYANLEKRDDVRVILSDEQAWQPSDHEKVLSGNPNDTYRIPETDHNFEGYEGKVAELVNDYVHGDMTQRYMGEALL